MLVLGIDSGEKSGWGIARGTPGILGRVLKSGVAKTPEERKAVVEEFRTFAEFLGEPCVAVYEDHTSMPLTFNTKHDKKTGGESRRSTKSIIGMGANVGRWFEHLDLAGIERRGVTPNDWFCPMSGMPASTKRKDRKAWSKFYARSLLGRAPKDDNEADGACISVWGCMNVAPTRRPTTTILPPPPRGAA